MFGSFQTQRRPNETSNTSFSTMSTRKPSILDLNNDVLVLICQTVDEELAGVPRPLRRSPNSLSSLKAFSMTCRRVRQLAERFLFDDITLGKSNWTNDVLRDGQWTRCVFRDAKWTWKWVRETLRAMDRCEAIKRHAKKFSMSLHINEVRLDGQGRLCRESALPERDLFYELARLWQSMRRLERLNFVDLSMCELHLKIMQDTFEDPDIEFGSVKTLAVPCDMAFMVLNCPNLRGLDVRQRNDDSYDSPIEAIRYTSGLKHLECRTSWDPEDLDEIREIAPDLETLALLKNNSDRRTRPEDSFLHVLSSFPNLRCLALSPLGCINVGLPEGEGEGPIPAWCDTAEQRIRERKRRAERKRLRLSAEIANAVFGSCDKLEEMWFGELVYGKATCVRHVDGAVKEIQWDIGPSEMLALTGRDCMYM